MYDEIRELHRRMGYFKGSGFYDEVIKTWLETDGLAARSWLQGLCNKYSSPQEAWDQDDSITLYALSRVIDLLLLSFVPQPEGTECWRYPRVTPNEFQKFTDTIGLETYNRSNFHPFFHEIVEVEEAPDEQMPPVILDAIWPGLKLGAWMISRSGCKIKAGINHIHKDKAEKSVMYWAYARNHRPTDDLSKGWGHNSQWRTRFRQDCEGDGLLYYNITDAKESEEYKEHMVSELSQDARIELVRHRCFVKSAVEAPHRDRDAHPYYLEHTEVLKV